MSLFGNINFDSNTSIFNQGKTTSLFENTSGGLFGNQEGGLFGNNNNKSGNESLFSNQNQNTLFNNINSGSTSNTSLFNINNNIFSGSNNFSSNNNNKNKECSIGNYFNGIEMREKNGGKIENVKYMSIEMKPEFSYASNEELRLADFEKSKTGCINQFKIINTSSNNNNSFNMGSIFTTNKTNTTNNNIFNTTSSGNKNHGGIFDNNQHISQFSFGNNNTKTERTGLFDNINTQKTNLFGNDTQSSSLFNNNNQGNSMFGNLSDNNRTQNGNLFGQGKSLFENDNKSIFGNNNNNQLGGLFGNKKSINDNKSDSILGNGNNANQGLFSNNNPGTNFFNTNKTNLFDDKKTTLFNNTNNNPFSLSTNNENNKNNEKKGNIFGDISSGLFNKNTPNNDSSKNNGSIFGNTTFMFGKSNNNISSNNANIGGILLNNNNSNNNNNSSSNKNSIINNIGTNMSLVGNTNNNNQNLNMNNNTPNIANTSKTPNSELYGNVTLEDIVNPLNYFNEQKSLKLSPQEEILAQSIIDAVQKQKSVEEFLKELDRKYENKNDDKNNNLLDIYGTYLNSSNDYLSDMTSIKRNLNVKNKINESSSYNLSNFNKMYNESYSIYNRDEFEKTMSKISEIYDEYERYKNNFKNIQMKNYASIHTINKKKTENGSFTKNLNSTYQNSKVNNSSNKSSSINNNKMMANDEMLYQRNLIEFNKLSNDNIMANDENENDNDENDIVITNFRNENNSSKKRNGKKAYNNNLNGKMTQVIDSIIIKYHLPEEDNSKKMHKINLESINKYVKIKTLREEINQEVYNELRLQNLHQKYSIGRISLLMSEEFLVDDKTLADYNLDNCDYKIKALITYNPININNKEKVKKEEQKNNDDELAPIDLVPKLKKEGYNCSPSIIELSRKTVEELKKVENFRIFNKFGEVEFKEPVNLLGINLDEQVTIGRNLIDTGDKLNYKSVFKLYNFKIGENGLNKYKVNLKELGGKFLSYNNNELVWEYNGNIPVAN